MSLLGYMQKENTILNTKGGLYYSTTYNANLDFFTGVSRYQDVDDLLKKFDNALAENETLALANLLLLLDIRGGKGERRLFKTCYRHLCEYDKDLALKILPLIPELGRWDYILEGIDTLINDETLSLIKEQFYNDLDSSTPSLLAKWLPSHRTHGKNNPLAKKIYQYLQLTEKQYRKLLKELRAKLELVENNLTNKDYEIDFEKVPTKAMLKYRKAFERHCRESYFTYLDEVAYGNKKINTKGLYCYEIVQKIIDGPEEFTEDEVLLLDNMWRNQKDFLIGNDSNILVMADTSDSMTYPDYLPLANSIGLALYIAERNHGFFHNYFLTFSDKPILQKVEGLDIVSKIANIEAIMADTNIDKAFKLILDAAKKENLSQDEMPSHIIIISDMEFDAGCYCSGNAHSGLNLNFEEELFDNEFNFFRARHLPSETNLEGWKIAFKEAGYILPKIIFWNVSASTRGIPATKRENDIAMVSGFSPFLLENILDPESINPIDEMMDILDKYLTLLEKE